MTALDHNHLVSYNCRDGYRTGPFPALLVSLLASALIFTLSDQAQSASFEPINRFIVQPRAGLADKDLDHELTAANAHRMGKLNGHNLQLVATTGPVQTASVLKRLKGSKLFKFVEQDARVAVAATIVTDPYYASSWHLPVIGAPLAWDYENGRGVVIAILDTGVDATHPDLAANIVPGWNLYDNNADTSDVYGHGTLVAGTASAAANNGIGSAGIAWGAKIMPVRIADATGYAYFSTIAQGIYWAADHGARVANVSFNGVAGSTTVQAAADYLRAKGGIVVVAAGNSGAQESIAPSSSLLAVSATDKGDVKASFTSTGSYVDLAAPGVSILTTMRGGGYGNASGTSFSSPLVAGTAALAMQANPSLTSAQVDNLLLSTAQDLGTAGYDTIFGYGRLNAGAVVAAALGTQGGPPVDNQAPTVAIVSPLSGSVSGLVGVNVNASDNVGVAKVDLYVNGAKVATDSAPPFAFSWDSTAIANGAASLTVYASDAAGNTTVSAPVSVTVNNVVADTTAPTVAISSPLSGTVSGTVAVSATASDNVGVTKVEFYLNGVIAATSTAAPYSFNWDSKTVANGTVSLTAYAYDAAGNKKLSAPVSVTVNNVVADTTAPTVAISSPLSGTVSGTVAVSATASDNVGVTKVEFYVNGVIAATSTAAPYSFSWDSTATANGAASLTAYAYDAAGNKKLSAPVSVTVNNVVADTTAPTVAISSPLSGTVSGTVAVSATASDNVGVTKVEFYLNGVIAATSTAAPYSFNWDSKTVANGTVSLTAYAYDAAGNKKLSAPVSVTVNNVVADTTAPTVAISSPLSGTVSGTVAVSATASDNVGVTKVEFYVNGVIAATSTAAPYSFNWDSKTVANGTVSLTAYAYDAAGNKKLSAPVSVTVNNVVADTTAPTVAISSPLSGTVSGTVAVSATASDNVGVTKVEFYVNGVIAATSTAAPYSFNWDSRTVANGTVSLTAYAYDAAGNKKLSAPVSVTVNNGVASADTQPPVVTLSGLLNGQKPRGTFTITVNATDNVLVSSVSLAIDGVTKASASGSSLSYAWKTLGYAVGTHTMTASAKDSSGNQASTTITFYQ